MTTFTKPFSEPFIKPFTEPFLVPGSFLPPEIPNLLAWHDAADPATIIEAGGLVSSWLDKSGNGNNLDQATGADQPTTGTDTINGLNVIRFDGLTDFLEKSGMVVGSDVTIFIVCFVFGSNNVTDSVLSFDAVGNDFQIEAASNIDFFAQFASLNLGAITPPQSPTNLVNLNTVLAYRLSSPSEKVTLRIDGAQVATDNYNGALTTPVDYKLATSRGGGVFLDARVAEVVIYLDDLTNSQMKTVEKYLGNKWGISV